MSPGDSLNAESRLLLDPCIDDPEEHIGFNLIGQTFAISNSPKGECSRIIYNLELTDLRKARYKVMRRSMALLKAILTLEDKGYDAEAHELRALLELECQPDMSYSAVARFVKNNGPDFTD